jgi:hypothetical protein
MPHRDPVPHEAKSEVSKDSQPSLIPFEAPPPHNDSSGRIRVLIADDHQILRQGLRKTALTALIGHAATNRICSASGKGK